MAGRLKRPKNVMDLPAQGLVLGIVLLGLTGCEGGSGDNGSNYISNTEITDELLFPSSWRNLQCVEALSDPAIAPVYSSRSLFFDAYGHLEIGREFFTDSHCTQAHPTLQPLMPEHDPYATDGGTQLPVMGDWDGTWDRTLSVYDMMQMDDGAMAYQIAYATESESPYGLLAQRNKDRLCVNSFVWEGLVSAELSSGYDISFLPFATTGQFNSSQDFKLSEIPLDDCYSRISIW